MSRVSSDTSSSGNKNKNSSSSLTDGLCCCEYENWKGERSHLLACCCDCEAIDDAVDRLFKCQRVPTSTIDKILLTLSDRLRVPSFIPMFSSSTSTSSSSPSGTGAGGAVKLRPDVVIPAVVVPLCLCMATLHPAMTVLSFLFMPVSMAIFLSVYRRGNLQRRTVFFYSWAMTSIATCYVVFQVFVVAFREVLLWEILLVFTMTVTLFRLLGRVRRDASAVTLTDSPTKKIGSGGSGASGLGHKRTNSNVALSQMTNQAGAQEVKSNHQLYDGTGQDGNSMATIPLDDDAIQWVDSRTSLERDTNRGEGYCDICRSHKVPRTGHCPRCQVCVAGRDHHCVWIDCCVGASNHRHFLAAMILFIVTGFYGVHLTMTTICTPVMWFDWFLWPNDCRWLYIDFLTSICFVTAIYSCMVSSLVCIALLLQLTLISQNLTGQEFVRASRSGATRFFLFVPNNPYNRGLFYNWIDFLFTNSRGADDKLPL